MLIDADEISRFIMHALFKAAGFTGNIIHCSDVEEAKTQLMKLEPDTIMLDFFLNESDRFTILHFIEKLGYRTMVVVMWDLNEAYVKQISVLFPMVTHYYQKPLKIENAESIIAQLQIGD